MEGKFHSNFLIQFHETTYILNDLKVLIFFCALIGAIVRLLSIEHVVDGMNGSLFINIFYLSYEK